MNDEFDFQEYMEAQTDAIEVAKWLLGEKLGRDPGDEFVVQWIRDNAEEFRRNWPTYSAVWREKKLKLHNHDQDSWTTFIITSSKSTTRSLKKTN